MNDPRQHALAVVRESLAKDPQFLIALHYLGMLKDDALLPIKEGSPLVEQIALIPQVREPVKESMVARFSGERIMREQKSPIHSETGRTLFSMWVEKEIPWSPAVMGWDETDPRVDAMYRETGG